MKQALPIIAIFAAKEGIKAIIRHIERRQANKKK